MIGEADRLQTGLDLTDIIYPMEFAERTTDIYEQIAGYPKPPLVPLPELDDVDTFQDMGVKLTDRSRWIMKQAVRLSGLRAFQETLANNTEDILRKTNIRGPGLYAPVISASLALTDDPRNLDPYQRAATLLAGARSLHRDIHTAQLEPDRFRDQILEMGQYPNLFATNVIVENNNPRLFKSANTEFITVIIYGQYYWFQAWQDGRETDVDLLASNLRAIAQHQSQEQPQNQSLSPGLLTTADDRTQYNLFHKLRQDPDNSQSLELIRHSFLTVCLDLDKHPSDDALVAFESQVGNNTNRWFHSSFQIIVFGNAKAAALCSFSAYLDGNVMMRGISEVHQRALNTPIKTLNNEPQTNTIISSHLNWRINQQMLAAAEKSFAAIADNQQATFTIDDFGRDLCSRNKVDAVPAFILALQMTANQLTGATPRITQFASMSRYRCMDLVTACVTTADTLRFAGAALHQDTDLAEIRKLMMQAIQSQIEAVRYSRRNLSLPNMLYYFRKTRSKGQLMRSQLVFKTAFRILRMMGEYQPVPREIVVSHPEIYPSIPVVGRPGVRLPYAKYFGLHYQIFEDRTVITMMPGITWKVPNSDLINTLTENLRIIANLITTH
jgi:hypothetical protein